MSTATDNGESGVQLPPIFASEHSAIIISLLDSSMSNPDTLEETTRILGLCGAVPNFGPLLLEIATNVEGNTPHVRLAAAIALRNLISNRWKGEGGGAPNSTSSFSSSSSSFPSPSPSSSGGLRDEDTSILRTGLLQALVGELENPIANTHIASLQKIMHIDWPHVWPDVFHSLLNAVYQSNAVIEQEESDPSSSSSSSSRSNPTGAEIGLLRSTQALNKLLKKVTERLRSEEIGMISLLAEDMTPQLLTAWESTMKRCIVQLSSSTGPTEATIALAATAKLGSVTYTFDAARCLTKTLDRMISAGPAKFLLTAEGKTVPQSLSSYVSLFIQILPTLVQAGANTEEVKNSASSSSSSSDNGSGSGSVIASSKFTEDCLDAVPGGGSFKRLLHRLIDATKGICLHHAWAFAAIGGLDLVLPTLASTLILPHPAPALPEKAIVSCLTLLTEVLSRANSFSMQDGSIPSDEEGGKEGPAAYERVVQTSIFGNENKAMWLQWLIGQCLHLTPYELEEFAEDGEQAVLADDDATSDTSVRKAAESLLLGQVDGVSDGNVAVAICEAMLTHATNVEQQAMTALAEALNNNSSSSSNDTGGARVSSSTSSSSLLSPSASTTSAAITHAILQLEAAWLAVGLLLPEAISRAVMTEQRWSDWCYSSLLPFAQACGLPVQEAAGLAASFPNAELDPGFVARVQASVSSIPTGALLNVARVPALALLRRLFFVVAIGRNQMPPVEKGLSSGGGGGGGGGAGTESIDGLRQQPLGALGPLATLFFILSLQAIEAAPPLSPDNTSSAAAAAPDDTAHQGMKLSAIDAASNLAIEASMSDPGLAQDTLLIACTQAVYGAVALFTQSASRLKALELLTKVIEKCPPSVAFAGRQSILEPLPSLWDISESEPMVKQHILSVVTLVVEAMNNTADSSSSSSSSSSSYAEETEGLLASIAPLISVACNATSDESLYLSSHGTALWEAVLERSPTYSATLHSLFPLLPGLAKEASADPVHIGRVVGIAASYAVCAGPALLLQDDASSSASSSSSSSSSPSSSSSSYSNMLASVFNCTVGKIAPRGVPAIASALGTVLSALPEQAPALFNDLWGRIALSLALGAVARAEEAAKAHRNRSSLLSALTKRTLGAGSGSGSGNSSNGLNLSGGLIDLGGFRGRPTGDDRSEPTAEPDIEASQSYGEVLARAWVLNPQVVLSSCSNVALTYPHLLSRAGLLTDEDLRVLQPLTAASSNHGNNSSSTTSNSGSIQSTFSQEDALGQLGNLFALRMLTYMCDAWLFAAAFEDPTLSAARSASANTNVGGIGGSTSLEDESGGGFFGSSSSSSSSSASNPTATTHTLLPLLWSKKLLLFGASQALRIGISLHRSLVNAFSSAGSSSPYTNIARHIATSPHWDPLCASSRRLEVLSEAVVQVNAGLSQALEAAGSSSTSGNGVGGGVGIYIPGIMGSPAKRNISSSSINDGGIPFSLAGGAGGAGVNVSSNNGNSSNYNNGEVSSARQRVFAARSEISGELGPWMNAQISALRESMNSDEEFGVLVVGRLSAKMLELCN